MVESVLPVFSRFSSGWLIPGAYPWAGPRKRPP